MNIPKKLADIYMEFIAETYLSESPFSKDISHFTECTDIFINNSFDISWSGGGTYGTCWDEDGPREEDEEEEPEMTELDNFLEKYFTDLDLDIILKIRLITKEYTEYENDYYGGQSSTHKKSLSFSDIAEVLIPSIYKNELDYIDLYLMINDIAPYIVNMGKDDYKKLTFNTYLNEKFTTTRKNNNRIKI